MSVLFKTINAYIRAKLGFYVTPHRYGQIFNEIEKIKAKNIMEIGTYRGARGEEMIRRAKKYTKAENINYFGFDLFEQMSNEKFKYEISKQPLPLNDIRKRLEITGAKIDLIKGNTLETLPKEISRLPKMDIIFIDGGHSYETILNDWSYSEKLMDKKTVVILDDYWLNRKDGARPIVDTIDKNKFNIDILPAVDVFFNLNFGRLVIQLAKVTRK